MAGGGEASTTRQKNFCVRIKVPLMGEFQPRISRSMTIKRPSCTMHHEKPEFGNQPDPVLNTVILLKCVKKPNKNRNKKNCQCLFFHITCNTFYLWSSHNFRHIKIRKIQKLATIFENLAKFCENCPRSWSRKRILKMFNILSCNTTVYSTLNRTRNCFILI